MPPPYPYPPPPPGWAYRPVRPVPVAPDGRPLADFGLRLLAHMIDGAIVYAVVFLLYLPVLAVLFHRGALEISPTGTTGVDELVTTVLLVEVGLAVLLLVGYFVYYVEMLTRRGQTVGKRAMKIQVVPLEPGAALTRGMAAKRYLVEYVAGTVVPLFAVLDGLWQLRDEPYQQTLHDKFARTVVVKVSP